MIQKQVIQIIVLNLELHYKKGMQRLIEYMTRCPFSLARIIKLTDTGQVLYRAVKSACRAFPISGNDKLEAGVKRNYEIFKPLDFLAEVTQYIPNKGEHQIRYYGFYSNKQRGIRNKKAEKGQLLYPKCMYRVFLLFLRK